MSTMVQARAKEEGMGIAITSLEWKLLLMCGSFSSAAAPGDVSRSLSDLVAQRGATGYILQPLLPRRRGGALLPPAQRAPPPGEGRQRGPSVASGLLLQTDLL